MNALTPTIKSQTATMSGAAMVMRTLHDQGVDTLFGYPGGAALPIYDALHQQNHVRHFLVRHEQAAVHAAQGYARATGRVGCVLVTSGPGATNTVTGLMDAKADSTPLVIITGQVASHLLGTDAFQECDTISITRPCTKHNYMVRNIEELPHILHEAFHIARSGRPGPVLVDIPKDIQATMGTYRIVPPQEFNHHRAKTVAPGMQSHCPDAIQKAADLIAQAKRPIFYTGGGVISAGDEAVSLLHSLAEKTGFPVTSTLMGLGGFPASSPQWLGMLGMHGTYEANKAMHAADLIIAIGARFDDRVTGKTDAFAPNAKKIHIDIDKGEINKIIPVDVALADDCRTVMSALLSAIDQKPPQQDLQNWWQQIDEWRAVNCLSFAPEPNVILPQQAIRELYRIVREQVGNNRRVILTTDVGQHQMFAAQHFGFDAPRNFITSGGLGTMGFGLPAAIGAQIADPDALVICITGDGSIQMNIQEMATARQYNLPVKVLLLNNQSLGMVRQWQGMFYENRLSQSQMSEEFQPDFGLLAQSYGWQELRCDRPEILQQTLAAMIGTDKAVFADIRVKNEDCFPMIAAGRPHNEVMLKAPTLIL